MAKIKVQASSASQTRLETINSLVQEVTKNKPDQTLVKRLMLEAGLEYESDLIRQMGAVLALVSQTSPDMKKTEPKKLKEADL